MSTQYVVGRRAVIEALNAGTDLQKIIVAYGIDDETNAQIRTAAQKAGVPISTMDRRKFQTLENELGTEKFGAQGVIALKNAHVSMPLDVMLSAAAMASKTPIIVAMDGIMDPGNLGAIARSAEGAGAFGLILPVRYSAPITPAVVKTSAGALEHLRVAHVPRMSEALKECKAQGWNIVGTAMPGTNIYTDAVYASPLVIVIGNESEGLHPSVQACCDALVEIPMYGNVASLNASVASGIVLFEAKKNLTVTA